MARVAGSHASLVSVAMLIALVAHGDSTSERTTSASAYLVSPSGCKFLNAGSKTAPFPEISWNGACVDGFVSGPGELVVKDRFDIVFRGQFAGGEITKGSVESRGGLYSGDFKANRPHGLGEISDPNRTWSAKGQFKDGKPFGKQFEMSFPNGTYAGEVNISTWRADGKGVFRYRDGGVYEGMMRNNLPHGAGEARTAQGEVRKGIFVDGNLEGKGTIDWADGTSYEGEVRVDQPHGLGKYKYADGTIYEGEFVAGDAHGKGKMMWVNGNAFEGDFLYGRPHGKGTYRFDEGNAVYTGEMIGGEFHGQGRAVSEAGTVKEGEWRKGKLHGKCHLSYPDGERFDGFCADDLYHGQGHLERAETGEVYEGEFRAGDYDGKGILRIGSYKFEGAFKQGMKEGFGKETDESGGEYEGNYSQNQWHGLGTLRVHAEDGTLVVYQGQFEKGAMHGAGKMTIGSRILDGEFRNNEFAKGIVSEGADRFEVDLQLGTVMKIMPDGSRRAIESPEQGI